MDPQDPWDVDHIIPISEAPELVAEMTNVRAVHPRCNRRRAAGLPPDPDLCMKGHRLEGDNLIIQAGGGRRCRECKAKTQREWQQEHRKYDRPGRPPAPTLLERGECKNGHAIQSLADIKLRRRPGREPYQECRECRREWERLAYRKRNPERPARPRTSMLERGQCPNGHLIVSEEDVYIYERETRRDVSCKACAVERYRNGTLSA